MSETYYGEDDELDVDLLLETVEKHEATIAELRKALGETGVGRLANTLGRENNELKARIAELEAENARLKSENLCLNVNLGAEIKRLEDGLRGNEDYIKELSSENQELKAENEALKQEHGHTSRTVDHWELESIRAQAWAAAWKNAAKCYRRWHSNTHRAKKMWFKIACERTEKLRCANAEAARLRKVVEKAQTMGEVFAEWYEGGGWLDGANCG